MSLITCLIAVASAAEVVWLTTPSPTDRSAVAAAAGASGAPLSRLTFKSAATRVSDDDVQLYARLAQVLSDVRAYETKLDGELLILRDLEGPLSELTVMRSEADRDLVFDALAYQGFAANRFWGEALGSDAEAEPWRVEHNGLYVERPWRDAVALAPELEVTAYQIAEAPQRVAYGSVQETVSAALPASLLVTGLDDALLLVDGVGRAPGAAGDVKVPPGRHFVHVERSGTIIARWTVSVEPGEQVPVDLTEDRKTWRAWFDALDEGVAVPEVVGEAVDALGGEVWIASGSGKSLKVFAVTPDAVTRQAVKVSGGGGGSGDEGGLSGWSTVGIGWLSSGNFYTDNAAVAKPERKTVNALTPSVALGVDYDVGLARFGAAVDLAVPTGEHHTVPTADGATRLRPQLQASAGITPIQATFGWLFSHHPAVGAQAGWSFGALELRGAYTAGLPGTVARDDGSEWQRLVVHRAGIAVGARIR